MEEEVKGVQEDGSSSKPAVAVPASELSLQGRKGFTEDEQTAVYMAAHEAQRVGKKGLGQSTATLKFAGGQGMLLGIGKNGNCATRKQGYKRGLFGRNFRNMFSVLITIVCACGAFRIASKCA